MTNKEQDQLRQELFSRYEKRCYSVRCAECNKDMPDMFVHDSVGESFKWKDYCIFCKPQLFNRSKRDEIDCILAAIRIKDNPKREEKINHDELLDTWYDCLKSFSAVVKEKDALRTENKRLREALQTVLVYLGETSRQIGETSRLVEIKNMVQEALDMIVEEGA